MLNYFNAPLVGSDPVVPPADETDTTVVIPDRKYENSYCYHENMYFNTGSDVSFFEGEYSDWSIRFET